MDRRSPSFLSDESGDQKRPPSRIPDITSLELYVPFHHYLSLFGNDLTTHFPEFRDVREPPRVMIVHDATMTE